MEVQDIPRGALASLVRLWFWRDVRFRVDEVHLTDERRPATPVRRQAREIAVRTLRRDFAERGGAEPGESELPQAPIWPPKALDRQLCQEAMAAGCDLFLTEDKQILRCHTHLHEHGLAVMTPDELLDAFEDGGESTPRTALTRPLLTWRRSDTSIRCAAPSRVPSSAWRAPLEG